MATRWLSLVVMGLVLWWPQAGATQSALPWIFHSGATAVGNGNVLQADYYSTIIVQIEGTFVGTVTFEKKSKDATNYVAVQCTNATDRGQTATVSDVPGYWECPGAAYNFRARISAYTSGTIVVTGAGTTAVSSSHGGSGGLTGWPYVFVAGGVTWASSLAQAFTFGTSTNYWAGGYDATDGLFLYGVCAGVVNGCDYVRKLNAGKVFELRTAANAPGFTFTNDTGAVTNMSLNAASTGNNVTLYQKICGGDLVAVDPGTGSAAHIWNKSPTATAPTAVAATGTNLNKGLARHPDSDGTYGVQLRCRLHPTATIGQVDGVLTWISAGTGNYRPQVQTKCYAHDTTDDLTFNTTQLFTVTTGTAATPQIDTLSSITMTGCDPGEILTIQLTRSRTEGSDTGTSTFDVESFELWAHLTY